MDAPAAYGEDGQLYLLNPKGVSVVSRTGDSIRSFVLATAEPEYMPFNIFYADRRLVITYLKYGGKGPATTYYSVVDAASGDELAVYKTSPELGNNLLCYTSEGFAFYRVEHGRAKLITAKAE
ncbi:MAG: hypothetical protein LAN64_09995 [Acidobacteriia bacterium]|nr:hypothetical protein [Terriglobia bacterium]